MIPSTVVMRVIISGIYLDTDNQHVGCNRFHYRVSEVSIYIAVKIVNDP